MPFTQQHHFEYGQNVESGRMPECQVLIAATGLRLLVVCEF